MSESVSFEEVIKGWGEVSFKLKEFFEEGKDGGVDFISTCLPESWRLIVCNRRSSKVNLGIFEYFDPLTSGLSIKPIMPERACQARIGTNYLIKKLYVGYRIKRG